MPLAIALLALVLFCVLFFSFKKSPRISFVFLVFSVVLFGAIRLWIADGMPKNDLFFEARQNKDSMVLEGRIVSEVEAFETFYGGQNVIFVLEAPNGRARCYLTNPTESLTYGDEVRMKGRLAIPKGVRNPGGFDKRAYLDRIGIHTLFYGDKESAVEILGRGAGNPLKAAALRVKGFLSESISEEFEPRDAAFLKALFLGERSGLDDDFKDPFIKTGTMHILAVSGFNIGFLLATLLFFLKPFQISVNRKRIAMIFTIWLYCFLVGWQAPLVRASFMVTVFIAGQLWGRKTHILNSLGVAALAILLFNPKQLFDVGFQLSFLAVFGIAGFVPLFVSPPQLLPNEKLTFTEKFLFYAKELFWVSFVCLFVTLPVTVQNFYIVVPLSLLANMIVVPLSFAVFFAGVCFFLTFAWIGKILPLIPCLIKMAMGLFVHALGLIEHIPGAYFICGRLESGLLVALIAGILYFLIDKKIKSPIVRAIVLFLFAGNIFLAQSVFRNFHDGLKMTVLDVGQGDAVYFEFPHGGNLLVDAGKGGDGDRGRWVIAPFLKSQGVGRLDAIVISHPQADHIGGFATVFDEFQVNHVISAGSEYASKTFERLKQKIAKERSENLIVVRGAEIEGFPQIQIKVLNPPPAAKPDKNINNDCAVLEIIYGRTRFLLTGDIEKKAMETLLQDGADISADVLKVPHHGAKMGRIGESFVKRVHPKISVISVGERNSFGHPSPATLDILSSVSGNQIFRTDRDGAVQVRSDGITSSRQKI